MEMIANESARQQSFGIVPNEVDLDKVSWIDQDEIFESLVKCLETEQEQLVRPDSSVEILGPSRKIYTYYSEETSVAVQQHFNRSLHGVASLMEVNSKVEQAEIPSKKNGRAKRKPKRKAVSASTPYQFPVSAQVVSYGKGTSVRPHSSSTFLVPARVEMFPNVTPRYTVPYGLPNTIRSSNCNVKTDDNMENVPGRQSAYTAFCNGRTVIEVYSPTVGRGFNPRYNSLLIEPTVQAPLPPISGQSPPQCPTQTEIQEFQQLAIEFNIPKQ